MNCIIQSNLGIFTDKPLFIMALLSLDSILVEKAAYWGGYACSSEISKAITELESVIKKLRGEERIESADSSLLMIEQPGRV